VAGKGEEFSADEDKKSNSTISSNAQLLREIKRREKELNQVRDLLKAKEEIIELLRFKIERLEHEG
jgi:hypothetical protein